MQKFVNVELPPGSNLFESITYETTPLEDLVGETAKRLELPYSELQPAQELAPALPELVRHGRTRYSQVDNIKYSRRFQQTGEANIEQENAIRELYEGRMPNIDERCSFNIGGKEVFAIAPIRQYDKLDVSVNNKPVADIKSLESLRDYLIQNLRIE